MGPAAVWEQSTEEELLALIRACSQGEGGVRSAEAMLEGRAALDELLRRNYDWIMRICLAELRSQSLALDCAQEVLMRIASSITRFRGDSKVSTWIYVILRRTINDFRRKQASYDARIASHDAELVNQQEGDPLRAPDAIILRNEQHDVILRLLDKLPARQREAITLHYLEDMSVQDAAKLCGCSESSFKTHLFRARAKLKASLEREEGE